MGFKSIYSLDHQKVVQRIIQARLNAKLTQEQAAQKLGRTQSYISKMESGQRKIDIPLIKALSEIYNKPIDYFFSE